MSKKDVITLVIAAYGAMLSTVVFLRQYFGDRVKLKIGVDKNMQIVGDSRYAGVTLTRIQVINVGRRPVTITTFGAISLYPKMTDKVAYETVPVLPSELTEGKYVTSFWPQAN